MSKQARQDTVAFVGLGMMGGPMAENLLKKGHPLVVYDIDKRKVDALRQAGRQARDRASRCCAPGSHHDLDGGHDGPGRGSDRRAPTASSRPSKPATWSSA